MTIPEEICAAAAVFCDAADKEKLMILSKAAEAELAARLRPGITEDDCHESFVCASAWLALSNLCAAGEAEGVSSFTAGDLTVTRDAGGGNCLRMQAMVLMAPYCTDSFVFRGVPG